MIRAGEQQINRRQSAKLGDAVILEVGEKVAADGKIIRGIV